MMSEVSPSPSPTPGSRSRPRSRSPPTFLEPHRLAALVAQKGAFHPLVRRHNIAKRIFVVYAQNSIVYHPVCFEELFFCREPPRSFRDLVANANRRNLGLRQDIPLNARNLWRIFHRQYIRQFEAMQPSTNHHCIYVQSRSPSWEELADGKFRRFKPLSENMFSRREPHQIRSNVTIEMPRHMSCMYHAPDLHVRNHGSIFSDDLLHHQVLFDQLGIENQWITPELASKDGWLTKDGVTATYSDQRVIQQLDEKLTFGLSKFHNELVLHLLSHKRRTDNLRANQHIHPDLPSVQVNVSFGFRRLQSDSCPSTWYYRDHKMPTIDTKDWENMPPSLSNDLFKLMEQATKFCQWVNPAAFTDEDRTQIATNVLNARLGHPGAGVTSRFEFVHVVLTLNTKLNKHIDMLNDHRPGYNHCVVYSFYESIDDVTYRVSIVMTTRYTVGSVIAQIFGEEPKRSILQNILAGRKRRREWY